MVDQPVSDAPHRGVTITDIDVPFWRIVSILIKWVFASIFAYIIILLIVALIVAAVGVVFYILGGEGEMMWDQWWR
jgi:hypothetical protein